MTKSQIAEMIINSTYYNTHCRRACEYRKYLLRLRKSELEELLKELFEYEEAVERGEW